MDEQEREEIRQWCEENLNLDIETWQIDIFARYVNDRVKRQVLFSRPDV